jgi:hypothetical protein
MRSRWCRLFDFSAIALRWLVIAVAAGALPVLCLVFIVREDRPRMAVAPR